MAQRYRNATRFPIDLASGRLIGPGKSCELPAATKAEPRDDHDQAHLDAGRLVALPTPTSRRTPPAPKPTEE